MGINESSTTQQITDGTAFTCLLGELLAVPGILPVDHRGTWALGSAARA